MTYSNRLNLIACLIISLLLSCACASSAQQSDAAADSSSREIEVANAAQAPETLAEPTQIPSETAANPEQSAEDNATEEPLNTPPNAAILCSAEGSDQLWFWDSQTAQWQLWEMVQYQDSAIVPQAIVPLAGASDEIVMIGTRIDEAGNTGLFVGRWRDGKVQWSAETDAASYTPNLNQFQENADTLYAIDAVTPPNIVRLNYDSCASGACIAEPVESVNLPNPSGTHTLVWDVASGGIALQTADGTSEPLATVAYTAKWLNDNQLIYLDAEPGESAGASHLMLKTVDENAVQLFDKDQGQAMTGAAAHLVDARAGGDFVLVALGDAAQPSTFTAVLVNVQNGEATTLTELSVTDWLGVQLAPSGRFAAIGRNDNLALFDLTTTQVVASYSIRPGQSQISDFSADSRWLLALTADGVEIIDLQTLEPTDAALPDMEPLGRNCSIGVFVDQ
jgi:hypothetical protein